LKPISHYLKEEPNHDNSEVEIQRSVRGLFFGMILAEKTRDAFLVGVFSRLAGGLDAGVSWLAAAIPGCSSPTDVDARWDEWVLRQKRVVCLPGSPRADDLIWLEDNLLFPLEAFDIPQSADLRKFFTMSDLVEGVDSKKVRDAARGKAGSLRILSAGRSDSLRKVVESYCVFLDAVATDAGRRSIAELLVAADEEFRKYKTQISATEE
jgi:hypothetical protein